MLNKLIKIIKKIKLRTVLVLIVLLVFNSYAWFVYSTKVAMGLDAHVVAWDIELKAGEGASSNMQVDVDRIYPGMETFTKTIEVNNNGEVAAYLTYTVESYTLLGSEYKPDGTVTKDDLKNDLLNVYPFKVSVEIDNQTLDPEKGKGSFIVKVEWPFESGKDTQDTYWGERAAEFYSTNPGKSSIHIDLLLNVEQTN